MASEHDLRFQFRINWGKLGHGLDPVLRHAQATVLDAFESELRSRLPDDLRDSIRRTTSQVIVDHRVAQAIEYGSRPHWTPIEELKKWAQRVGKDDDPGAAYRIQRAIAERGTPAHPFMRPAIDALDIDSVLTRSWRDYFNVRGL